MSDHYSTETVRIRALTMSMVSLLESARDEEIPVDQLERGAGLLTEAYQSVLNVGTKQLVGESAAGFDSAFRAIEVAYRDWRAVESTFARTLDLAYNGTIPSQNLQGGAVLAQLEQRVGDRIAALHSKIHAAWKDHVKAQPWDEFLAEPRDVDAEDLTTNVKLLVQGDHLDVEDAVETLSGPLRHSFASYLSERHESLHLLEESLWMRPEILLINDYWRPNRQLRLIDLLTDGGSKRSGSFAQVQSLITSSGNGKAPAEFLTETMGHTRLDERDTYFRCLMLHPDHVIRRYAVNNVDLEGFWKVATPHAVPCATILSMVEKVARSQYYNEDFQKVFFGTIHKRLFTLNTRSEVLYTRGIIRILSELPFFMEDDYFEKLTTLIDFVSHKEKAFRIEQRIVEEFADQLQREKDKIGTLKGQAPNLTTVPPVVLRKLARDGHYWFDLAMHPMYKIARETIPHINSPERALRVAKNHVVNQDVLRAVGKKRSLFNSLPAKMTLLSNPRTPPTVSIGYIMDLTKGDVAQLLRRATVHPELRLHLRNRLRVS